MCVYARACVCVIFSSDNVIKKIEIVKCVFQNQPQCSFKIISRENTQTSPHILNCYQVSDAYSETKVSMLVFAYDSYKNYKFINCLFDHYVEFDRIIMCF